MKKFTKVFLLSVVMLLSSIFVFAQQMQISNTVDAGKTVMAPADSRAVLYEQVDFHTNGSASQDFETAYNAYDCQGADDFLVPTGEDWNIQTVIVYGSGSPGPFNVANVEFYNDAGGIPNATPFASFMGVTAVDNSGDMTIDLPASGINLAAGHYWMSVQDAAPFASNGQWFWTRNNTIHNTISHWRNPGGGFGLPATWTSVNTLWGNNTDFTFTLDGAILAPCDYQIALYDQYGDGWNGGHVTVYVDGSAVLSNITLASGSGPEYHTFSVLTGSEITTSYSPGNWAYENTYEIIDAGGDVVYTDGAGYATPTGIGPGVLFGDCPTIGTIDGYVFNGDGLTIAGATVGIEALAMSTTSASDGYYSLDPVQSGTWDLQGWKAGYNVVVYSVIINAGANTVQDIVLTQPGMVINPLQLHETLN
ncbi:MAG: carboxypeptidase-like regulatory domain-containing protein, partial [Bacteroidales bacterium]|nr:carboxypeptidase-like regulatory domain-containing protein [Bacteroidales bacterium]